MWFYTDSHGNEIKLSGHRKPLKPTPLVRFGTTIQLWPSEYVPGAGEGCRKQAPSRNSFYTRDLFPPTCIWKAMNIKSFRSGVVKYTGSQQRLDDAW